MGLHVGALPLKLVILPRTLQAESDYPQFFGGLGRRVATVKESRNNFVGPSVDKVKNAIGRIDFSPLRYVVVVVEDVDDFVKVASPLWRNSG